ncbi:geranyl-CoA carboxylase beta subunit [Ferrimonas sediminum]|uniref:Geranyl-CoA carboxylase beta subunit n=1 Tax=Ferrimonas sediminum TaxID=718193 RepID=A0A1G8S4C7_9GAMM|nr:carboxyl transferase domain-containing protein [Ferrimonas sediminum]SDJ24114.1 geranyl-CoA carboxylase beta subunit [Ferrimonas sediminum]
MAVIESQFDPLSAEGLRNRTAMESAIDRFRQVEAFVEDTANRAADTFARRGQLLPRQRLGRLLDPGAPFIELSSLAGYQMDDDKDGSGAGGGCIAGLGYVADIRCLVVVDNCAIKGGTISPMGLKKKLRVQQIALENRLPIVTLAQSGGANLNYAADTFCEGGRAFANQARLSAVGIPQITVVHGSATAGGAYQPGLSDYVIMVKRQASMYLAGPPLLKAATGEIATDEELGGAEMHIEEVGSGEYLADNDADAIELARQVMAQIGPPTSTQESQGLPPRYDEEELLHLVPEDAKTGYDVRELVARIADDSRFLDFKASFDRQTVCGHLSIGGHRCGLIGNNGPITHKGANKAAQFIQLCEQSGLPLLFFHNTTGFMVGTESERSGIIKHGSKLIQAVANARVPKLSLLVGGSYGAGNYAMCGRGFDPRFIFAWPNSRTAVMGPSQAGQVLRIVAEAKMQRAGQVDDAQLDALQQRTEAMMEATSSPLACTARLWDDGMIDPRDSRRLLSLLLDVCLHADRQLTPNHFGVSRF